MLKLRKVDKEVLHLLNESLSNWLVVTESLIKILGQVIKTQEETKFLLKAPNYAPVMIEVSADEEGNYGGFLFINTDEEENV